jgi:hypothetical protein
LELSVTSCSKMEKWDTGTMFSKNPNENDFEPLVCFYFFYSNF